MTGDAADGGSTEPDQPVDTQRNETATWWSSRRLRRLATRAVLILGFVLTGMCLALLIACFLDDRAIEGNRGHSVAAVLGTSTTRTVVRFTDDEGRVHIPQNGVLYPEALQKGQMVRVEYDTTNPELVRVADRTATVALLPVGSALGFAWLVLLPAWYFLRVQEQRLRR